MMACMPFVPMRAAVVCTLNLPLLVTAVDQAPNDPPSKPSAKSKSPEGVAVGMGGIAVAVGVGGKVVAVGGGPVGVGVGDGWGRLVGVGVNDKPSWL